MPILESIAEGGQGDKPLIHIVAPKNTILHINSEKTEDEMIEDAIENEYVCLDFRGKVKKVYVPKGRLIMLANRIINQYKFYIKGRYKIIKTYRLR